MKEKNFLGTDALLQRFCSTGAMLLATGTDKKLTIGVKQG